MAIDDNGGSSSNGNGNGNGSDEGLISSAVGYVTEIVDDTWDIAVPTTKATIKAAIVGFIPLLELALLAGLTVAIVKAPAKLFGIGSEE